MIERWMNAQTADEKTLAFLQVLFAVIAAFGFAFYGIEHWVIDHNELASWQSRIPGFVSLIGAPLALAMLFTTHKAVIWPAIAWMAVSVLTGLVGAVLHLWWNAGDLGVNIWSISGIVESMQVPYRPVLAALAHTHVGAVGLAVALTAWVKN